MALFRWQAQMVAILSILVPPSCVTSPGDDDAEVTVHPKPEYTPEQESAAKDLKKLSAVTSGHSNLERVVEDVALIFQAKLEEANGNHTKAQTLWKKAVTVARGKFGEIALEGWVKSYCLNLGKKTDRNVLAKLLIAELDSGRIAAALIESGLDDEDKMANYLASTVPQHVTPLAVEKIEQQSIPKGVPKKDPLLRELFTQRCSDDSSKYDWNTWQKTLDKHYQQYWDGLLAICRSGSRALSEIQILYPKLAAAKKYGLAAELAEKAAVMHRHSASREGAADAYRDLMDYWQKGSLQASDLGLEAEDFTLRRVNEHMWASRYRALIGDYELAKIFAQRGLDFAAKGFSEHSRASNKFREELAVLRAEGYHILAYRVALEKKEYQSALSLSKLALESSYLTDEWEDRLVWLIGLYEYLLNNHASAIKNWQKLLAQTDDLSMKSAAYFWLIRAYEKTGQTTEARSYLMRLSEEFPLSYYSVVGTMEAGLVSKPIWPAVFGDMSRLTEKFKERTGQYDLATLRKEPVTGTLLMRAEILVSAGLHKWAQMATNELALKVSRYNVGAYPGLYVYLSRLHYGAGNYLAAISVTTKVANEVEGFWQAWPEQLLVYFPRPYADIFKRNSLDYAVSEELLYGISRQESGFRADIKSHANAIGIMQLIPATGERFRGGVAMSQPIETVLLDPEANIAIGSRYLKHLNTYYKGDKANIFAGYNAGEYAVDAWIERRHHDDDLVYIETIPFGETKGYVKNVWRNLQVYQYIQRFGPKLAGDGNQLFPLTKFASSR